MPDARVGLGSARADGRGVRGAKPPRSGGSGHYPPRPTTSGVLEAEADLEPDLIVGDVAVDDLAADLRHLEPVQVPQGLRGALQRALDRRLDSGRAATRRAD